MGCAADAPARYRPSPSRSPRPARYRTSGPIASRRQGASAGICVVSQRRAQEGPAELLAEPGQLTEVLGGLPAGSRVALLQERHHDLLHEPGLALGGDRSEEHTSELQSLMRISYAVFCLKKK